jgi:predicted nucleotidyltransferase
MEIQLKRAVRAGNSSAVILPKAWLNQEVRVELVKKTPEIILLDVIEIVKKHINLSSIIGIYLTGSYARGEEDENSDIDILIITNKIDKESINEGIYNILIISSELLKQKLTQDLFPLGQMIKEAKPILNSSYLDSIEMRLTRKNLKWYIDTTEHKLKLIKKVMDKIKKSNKKYVSNKVAYTLILRIRTLHIIKKLIESENYSKKEFIQIIKKVSKGTASYGGYLDIKNNSSDSKEASIDEIERLYEYLKGELLEVRKMINKL